MDINGKLPRGRTNCLSNISFRDLPAHSSVSSILYMKRMEIQNNDLSWAVNEEGLVSLPTLFKSPNMPLSLMQKVLLTAISAHIALMALVPTLSPTWLINLQNQTCRTEKPSPFLYLVQANSSTSMLVTFLCHF